jgi:tellurite resistance protein
LHSFNSASPQTRFDEAALQHIMTDLEEQRRKVDELKKKILEQKTKGTVVPVVHEAPQQQVATASTIIPIVPVAPPAQHKEEKHVTAEVPRSVEHETQPRSMRESVSGEIHDAAPMQERATAMIALQAYAQALKQAWSDGSVSKDEQGLLLTLRQTLGISDEEHKNLEHELQMEVYLHALTLAWKNGGMSAKDSERLEFFRDNFRISSDEHFRLEKQVREELMRTK